MRYRITQFRVPVEYDPGLVHKRLARILDVPRWKIRNVQVVRESLDARNRPEYVLTVVFNGPKGLRAERYEEPEPPQIPFLHERISVAVVGTGPAGLMAAHILTRGGVHVTMYEQGAPVEERVRAYERFLATRELDPHSNLLKGEGGAGTFSDGKLTTRRNDPLLRYFFSYLVRHGAPQRIEIMAKPHVGTDRLRAILPSIRRELAGYGVNFLWNTRVLGVEPGSGGVEVRSTEGSERYDAVILAIGGSAEELVHTLRRGGFRVEARPWQVGVRMEQPTEQIRRAVYGRWHADPALPPAEYNFVMGKGALRTFCMCPGGEVVCAAGEPGRLVVNGMSESHRSGAFSNSALITTMDGLSLDEALELRRRTEEAAFEAGGSDYTAPAQDVKSFLGERMPSLPPTSYRLGVREADLASILPAPVVRAMKQALPELPRKLRGIDHGLLLAPETRVAPPWRIVRDPKTLEARPGVYPAGEGSGYASGISTSALDGMRVAMRILERFKTRDSVLVPLSTE